MTNRENERSPTIAPASADDLWDCVILGAGPAGLTALTYLARFHRRAVALGGAGPRPRSALIDRSYNVPGFPDGIPGQELIERLRQQAVKNGGLVQSNCVQRVEGHDGKFVVQIEDGPPLRARKVILAMGVQDREPDVPGIGAHEGGFLRYCPICDGYEFSGQRLGIVGSCQATARHALFLRTFSNDVSVFLHGNSAETLGKYQEVLARRGIGIYEARIAGLIESDDGQEEGRHARGVCLEDGSEHLLAVLYGALGCNVNLEPVRHLSLDVDEEGYVVTDADQQTSIKGIYAVGDLVSQINQISIAFGQATIAAVKIHNALDDEC